MIEGSLAGGIAAGRLLHVARKHPQTDGGAAIPPAVYADKAGKHLIAVDGLLLE